MHLQWTPLKFVIVWSQGVSQPRPDLLINRPPSSCWRTGAATPSFLSTWMLCCCTGCCFLVTDPHLLLGGASPTVADVLMRAPPFHNHRTFARRCCCCWPAFSPSTCICC